MSQGKYFRYGLFNPRRRYVAAMAQRSEAGAPVHIVDADFTDWARITLNGLQRLGRLFEDGTVGADAWRLDVADAPAGNFLLRGGNNTHEGAKAAYVGGLRAQLYQTTDYKCEITGAFDVTRADEIHRRYSSLAFNTLTDVYGKYTPNALVGYQLHVGGAGNYTITANTATTFTLAGFNPAVLVFPHNFYWVVLKAPVADVDQGVYLDVHVEDWGADEDSALNHNPNGARVEGMRRLKVVQQVWVEQVVGQQPTAATYVDNTVGIDGESNRHFVLKLGTLRRQGGSNDVDEVDNSRNENAGSPPEVIAARAFRHTCVVDQPEDLAEHLERAEFAVTVGPGSANPGMYNGPAGLLAALACKASTIYVKSGNYDFTGLGQVVIPPGRKLIGVEPGVAIQLDATVDSDSCLKIQTNSSVERMYLVRGSCATSVPAVQLSNAAAQLRNVTITDLNERLGCSVLMGATLSSSQVEGCLVQRTYSGCALRTAVSEETPPDDLGEVGFNNEPNAATGAYGAKILNSAFVVAAADAGDEAVVNLGSGVTYLNGCVIKGTAALLTTGGSYLNNASSPFGWAGRDSHHVVDNVFVSEAGNSTGNEAAVTLGAALTKFEQNIIDCHGASSLMGLPLIGVTTYAPAPAAGHFEIRRNFIRGPQTGVHVRTVGAYREAIVEGNVVLPFSPSLGCHYGISVDDRAGAGVVDIRNNYICGNTQSASLLRLSGRCCAAGNHLEGTQTLMVSANTDGTPSTANRSIGVTLLGGQGACMGVTANTIHGLGGVGVYVAAGSVDGDEYVIEHNTIDMAHHGLVGVLVDDYNMPGRVHNNTVSRCKRQGVHVALSAEGTASAAVVTNNTISNVGTYFDVAAMSTADDRISASAIVNGFDVRENTIRTPRGYGIASTRGRRNGAHVTIKANYISAAGKTGIAFIPGYCDLPSPGVIVGNTVDNPAENGATLLPGAQFDDNVVSGAEQYSVLCATLADTSTTYVRRNTFYVNRKSNVDDLSFTGLNLLVFEHNTIQANSTLHGYALKLNGVRTAQVDGNTIHRGGSLGVYLAGVGLLRFRGNQLVCGNYASNPLEPNLLLRSLYAELSGLSTNEISDNTFQYGLALIDTDGTDGVAYTRVVNNTFESLGVYSRMRRVLVADNRFNGVDRRTDTNPVDASSVWVGSTDQAPSAAVADRAYCIAEISRNHIAHLSQVGRNVSSAVAAGRAAGIAARGSNLLIKDNVIHDSTAAYGIGILVGSLNYLEAVNDNDAAYRVGAGDTKIVGNSVRANALNAWPSIVAVLAPTASCVANANSVSSTDGTHGAIEVYAEDETGSNNVLVFMANTAVNGTGIANWGPLRVTANVQVEVGMSATERASVTPPDVDDIIQRSNAFSLGAAL